MIRWVVDNLSLSPDDALVVIYNPAWMSMKNFMPPDKIALCFRQISGGFWRLPIACDGMQEQLADRDDRIRPGAA
eukprot:Skav227861  [mRNA]  locus=scaffold383:234502:235242:+ [translate_table: standard]